jgi:acetyl-CoA acetyltransferase
LDIETAFVGNAVAGLISGQEMARARILLSGAQTLDGVPIFAVENACASSSSAFHLAWLTVASGQCDIALALGAEKLTSDDRERAFRAISTAVDLETEPEVATAVAGGAMNRSFFMDIYAAKATAYRERTGATLEDFARVVVKSHEGAAHNPKAQYRTRVSVEEVLNSRQISGDLTLLMCSPVGDGAAAAVLVAGDALARFDDWVVAAAVRIGASVVRSGQKPSSGATKATVRAAEAAYEMAGLGPRQIGVAEVHDAAAPEELEIYEHLQFAPVGEGVRLIRDGTVALGGRLPVNTSGGLICRGHPIGATGLAQIVEIVTQLRRRAGERQVENVTIGLTHNAGGWVEGDNAVASVHILAAD